MLFRIEKYYLVRKSRKRCYLIIIPINKYEYNKLK